MQLGFGCAHNAGECGWFRDCDADNPSPHAGTWRTVAVRACAAASALRALGPKAAIARRGALGQEGKDVEGVPVVVADDWGTSWVVGEHHHEAG